MGDLTSTTVLAAFGGCLVLRRVGRFGLFAVAALGRRDLCTMPAAGCEQLIARSANPYRCHTAVKSLAPLICQPDG